MMDVKEGAYIELTIDVLPNLSKRSVNIGKNQLIFVTNVDKGGKCIVGKEC